MEHTFSIYYSAGLAKVGSYIYLSIYLASCCVSVLRPPSSGGQEVCGVMNT